MQSERPIVIAGGGPVGVVTALALARQGLEVRLFEAEARVNDSPRAATTHAATLEILENLGLVEEVTRRGLIEPKFRIWDRASRTIIAEFDFGVLKNDTRYPYVVQCEQHKLANIALDRLRALPNVAVEFSARVGGFEQFDDRVEVEVETANGSRRVSASYLIGADGGRSTVRKGLEIEFQGYTHPERFLVLTTTYPFGTEFAECSRNYFSDPDEWAALFKVTGDDGNGLWRVVFPTRLMESEEEAFEEAAVQARLQRFFPKPGPYPVVHRNIYNVHQRVAAAFRRGRAFLAGDSAHVNNPLGGLGLNFGIHDGVELSSLLGRVIRREVSPDILDLYDRFRRPLNVEYVQQQTIANKKRLEEKDPAMRAKSNASLRAIAADPAAHRAYLLRASLIDSVRKRQAEAV
ncbi:MAG TPA: NAD(P)/FAD-dependent oxidoreductase [Xanthobacteraceae bacterium]|nr:NAD(P)/FAD-dependent oxidoreductase [Xanthobacteraceae bacterium]